MRYACAMALNRPALVDALTDAGLEAEAVRRAVDVLEQDYADTAKQAEMHLRFSALEKNLADHDRLNEAQAAGAETRFKSLGDRLQDFREEVEHRFADLKGSMDREFAAVRGEMRNEFAAVRGEIAGLRNEMKTEFAAVRNEMRNEFAAVRNEMRNEFAAVRREMTMMRWVLGGLVVMNATMLGIMIDRLF